MRHLLRLISIRYLRAAPGRTFLTLFGIMLGVAVVFAIDVVNGSVMGSFRNTIDDIAGKTALTVGSGAGVDEEALEQVRAVNGVATAVPVIEENARDQVHGTELVVLGVDTLSDSEVRDYEVTSDDVKIDDDIAFLNDPHAVIVTKRFAQRTGIKLGDTLKLETVSGTADFTVRGTLAPRGPANVFGGDLLLMDVYAAQIAFGRGKRFDRIDVIPVKGVDVDTLQGRIERALGGKSEVARPGRRTQEAEHLVAGFKLGLQLASLVAIFVGGFIVYNALAIAVAQRRREIGILRALGATRGQVLLLFVGEGVVLGALGAATGVGAGIFLAKGVLHLTGSTISMLYVSVHPEALAIKASDVIIASALGVGASFIAAFFPARHAASIEPASVMRKKSDASDVIFSSTRTSLQASFATLLVALVAALYAHHHQNYLVGYGVAGILGFTAAFLSPALARGVGLAARDLAKRIGPSALLGTVSFTRNSGRNAVAIAALGMSLANVVNADTFVGSMKHNTARWFERAARADVWVFAGRKNDNRIQHPLPASVGDEIASLPGVVFVDSYRMARLNLNGQPYNLASYELDHSRRYNDIPIVSGDLDRAIAMIDAGKGLGASEVFAREFHVKVGDHITLQTPSGPRNFEIAMIYVDYSAQLGILLTTRAVYTKLWKDTLVESFGVYLKPGTSVESVREGILAKLGQRYDLLALGNGEYKADFMKFIDASFALTRATEIIAIIVAVLGIINTLLVTVIDRRTEIGVLRAVGAEQKQIRAMLLAEGMLIGLSATLLGISFGTFFSAYVVKELLRFQIGWQMTWSVSGWVLFDTFLAAQLVTLLAVWWPMRSAGRVDAVEALQYE